MIEESCLTLSPNLHHRLWEREREREGRFYVMDVVANGTSEEFMSSTRWTPKRWCKLGLRVRCDGSNELWVGNDGIVYSGQGAVAEWFFFFFF